MKLLFNVNLAEAIRRGIDAKSSTALLDIDPEQLTEQERAVLSSTIQEGNHATGRVRVEGLRTYEFRICEPTVQGVRDAIAEYYAQQEKDRVEAQAKTQAADADIRRVIQEGPEYTLCKYLGRDGTFDSNRPFFRLEGLPQYLNIYNSYASEEARAELEAAEQGLAEEIEQIRLSKLPEVAAKVEEERLAQAKVAEAKQRAEAEYAEQYARLPELLRERHAEGYATDEEVTRELKRLFRADAGYETHIPFKHSEAIESLTDEEFQRLKEVRKTAPEGATVTAVEVWDEYLYRAATEDDNPEDIDRDGEVKRAPDRRLIRVEWERAGIEVAVGIEF